MKHCDSLLQRPYLQGGQRVQRLASDGLAFATPILCYPMDTRFSSSAIEICSESGMRAAVNYLARNVQNKLTYVANAPGSVALFAGCRNLVGLTVNALSFAIRKEGALN